MSTVSVVIATIPPREQLLRRALASVGTQSREPDEIVVQLDEAGDGAGPTRNKGIARASGDYVAILDDDDELRMNHLRLLMAAAEEHDADVAYSWFEKYVDGRRAPDHELATKVNGRLVHPLGVPFGSEQAEHMRRYAWIPACLLLRQEMVLAVGGYPAPGEPDWERHAGCEDWALLIRLLDAGAKIRHVPVRTWRLHAGNGTAGRPWRTTDLVLSRS